MVSPISSIISGKWSKIGCLNFSLTEIIQKHGIPPCFCVISRVSSSHQYARNGCVVFRLVVGLFVAFFLDDFWFGIGYEAFVAKFLTNHVQFFCHLANSFSRRANSSSTLRRSASGKVDFCACDDA